MSDVVALLAKALRTGCDRPPGGLTRDELKTKLTKELGSKPPTSVFDAIIPRMIREGRLRAVYGSERTPDGRSHKRCWYVATENQKTRPAKSR